MRRILFVKTSSLGDVVHHAPAVSDAAREAPAAEIHWVVEEPFADVARMHRAVKRVFPVALRRWRRSLWSPSVWSEIRRFRAALAEQPYDAVVDSQGLLKSALVCLAARGTRHGLDRASAREPLAARFYDVRHAVPKGLHAVERNRRLTAAALGYGYGGELDYGLRPDKESSLRESYSVFLTMTSREDKLWPEERWIELGAELGMKVLLPWGRRRARKGGTYCAQDSRSDGALPDDNPRDRRSPSGSENGCGGRHRTHPSRRRARHAHGRHLLWF
jgi:heptosyltransferase-1